MTPEQQTPARMGAIRRLREYRQKPITLDDGKRFVILLPEDADDILAHVERLSAEREESGTMEQRFPALNDHLLRMASSGNTGWLSDWGDFVNCLRAAITQGESRQTGGEN